MSASRTARTWLTLPTVLHGKGSLDPTPGGDSLSIAIIAIVYQCRLFACGKLANPLKIVAFHSSLGSAMISVPVSGSEDTESEYSRSHSQFALAVFPLVKLRTVS